MVLQDLQWYEGLTPAQWAFSGWEPALQRQQTQYRQLGEDSLLGLPGLIHLPLWLVPFLSNLVSAAVDTLRAMNPGVETHQVLQCHRLSHHSLSYWVLDCRVPPPSLTSTRTSRSSESSTLTLCAHPIPGLGTATHLNPVGLAALGPLPPSMWDPLHGVLTGSLKPLYQQSLALLLRPQLLSKSLKHKHLPTCWPWLLIMGLLKGSLKMGMTHVNALIVS